MHESNYNPKILQTKILQINRINIENNKLINT